MSDRDDSDRLGPDGGQLVDLLSAVLVDPNLHTETRMRLQREISELLRAAHDNAGSRAQQTG